jgi:hypothetical protein
MVKKKKIRCSVCRYMKAHGDFRLAVLNSNMFNRKNPETLPQVMYRYNITQFSRPALYQHIKKHMQVELAKDEPPVIISGIPIDVVGADIKPHEIGLDHFIKLGTEKLKRGEMPITASNYLQAIKTKADIDKSNKDRKVDVLKSMFAGAAPSGSAATGTEQPTGTN